jgi:hypothetical protein
MYQTKANQDKIYLDLVSLASFQSQEESGLVESKIEIN